MIILPFTCGIGMDFYRPILWEYEVCDQIFAEDITGYSAQWDIRWSNDQTNPALASISTNQGGIVIDGSNGKMELWLPASMTSELPEGCLVHNLVITNTIGLKEHLFGGPFKTFYPGVM